MQSMRGATRSTLHRARARATAGGPRADDELRRAVEREQQQQQQQQQQRRAPVERDDARSSEAVPPRRGASKRRLVSWDEAAAAAEAEAEAERGERGSGGNRRGRRLFALLMGGGLVALYLGFRRLARARRQLRRCARALCDVPSSHFTHCLPQRQSERQRGADRVCRRVG